MVIANGLKAAKDKGEPHIDGKVLMPYFRRVQFSGVSGDIAFQTDTNDRAMMDIGIMKLEGMSSDGTETVYTEIGRIHGNSGRFERYETSPTRPGSGGVR
ncbi:hypothetical protein [Endozoicomonas sp.]|uniref:hypothetical protein n=1 Tax=Endozoicomonas sp. TaxID=1892382 RepID=UPI002888D3E4|nr:hypothetical protein [Endozoicomonas sp.]